MILSWALIGIIVGLLLGLTGAGGAVIAIPLFVHLTGASLRDATVLSLAAVMSGAVLNWAVQRKHTDFRTGSLLFLFSVAGSYSFKPFKTSAPEWVILTLFIGVGVLSLLSVWLRTSKSGIPRKGAASSKVFIKSLLGGFSLGALVTMTGLGGGVVLVPLLTGPFGMLLSQAAATSLYTIILSAASSLVLQWTLVSKDISIPHLLVLAAGSAISAQITKQLLLSVSPSRMDQVRKIVISVVILISIISLSIHSAQSKERNIDMSTRSIHMTELKDKYQNLGSNELILDTRTPEEFAEGHVPGSKNIDHSEVEKHAEKLSKYDLVYVYCRSGRRAQTAVDSLSKLGLKNLVLIKDSGMLDWAEKGLPTQQGAK